MKWIILIELAVIGLSIQSPSPPLPAPTSAPTLAPELFPVCKIDTSNKNKLRITNCVDPLKLNAHVWKLWNIKNKENIKNVFIAQTIIDGIENNTFEGFIDLRNVIISEAVINNIESNVFDGIDIETLHIKDSHLNFEPKLTSDTLAEFICNNCSLSEIPVLDNLPNLEYLNLTNNDIKSIELLTFSNLENLQDVSLVNNKLSYIPPNLFANNTELTKLSLDGNQLDTIEIRVPTLEILSLESCHLRVFDELSSKELNEVIYLNLKNNQISNLTATSFNHMYMLETIDLSDNNLGVLDSRIFRKNLELDKIILDNNLLKTLPNFFIQTADGAFKVTYFSCNNCGISSITNQVFANMPELSTLLLARNNLDSLNDNSFSNLLDLIKLDLSDNQIRMIDEHAFSNNKKLRVINLSGNPLKSLDPIIFKENSVLKTLDVRCTQLKTLWSNHNTMLPSLEHLYASDNDITDLSIDDFKITTNLKIIDLTDNDIQSTPDTCALISKLRNIKSVKYDDKTQIWDIPFYQNVSWDEIFDTDCKDFIIDPEVSSDYITKKFNEDLFDDYRYADDDSDSAEDDDTGLDVDDYEYEYEEKSPVAQIEDSLKAASILSLTAAFICTAVIVLIAAVTITLCILKRNNTYNKNLPHIKIPLWKDAYLSNMKYQKKHSGSVYRPLSEDLSGLSTPKFNRYEFLATPTVHSSNNP